MLYVNLFIQTILISSPVLKHFVPNVINSNAMVKTIWPEGGFMTPSGWVGGGVEGIPFVKGGFMI